MIIYTSAACDAFDKYDLWGFALVARQLLNNNIPNLQSVVLFVFETFVYLGICFGLLAQISPVNIKGEQWLRKKSESQFKHEICSHKTILRGKNCIFKLFWRHKKCLYRLFKGYPKNLERLLAITIGSSQASNVSQIPCDSWHQIKQRVSTWRNVSSQLWKKKHTKCDFGLDCWANCRDGNDFEHLVHLASDFLKFRHFSWKYGGDYW